LPVQVGMFGIKAGASGMQHIAVGQVQRPGEPPVVKMAGYQIDLAGSQIDFINKVFSTNSTLLPSCEKSARSPKFVMRLM